MFLPSVRPASFIFADGAHIPVSPFVTNMASGAVSSVTHANYNPPPTVDGGPVLAAIRNQPGSEIRLNTMFGANRRPHVLMLTTQGYAGHRFPTSATDSGGQITYVNCLAEELAKRGYKVTIVSRGFDPSAPYVQPTLDPEVAKTDANVVTPDENLLTFGPRIGVSFAPNNTNIRYLYVPGTLGGFVPKEQIYPETSAMAENLAMFLKWEANELGLKPYDPNYMSYMVSHYVDAGIVAQKIAHLWQSEIAFRSAAEVFRPIILDEGQQDPNFMDNIPYILALNAQTRWTTANSVRTLRPDNAARFLDWVLERLDLPRDAFEESLRIYQSSTGNPVDRSEFLRMIGDTLLERMHFGQILAANLAPTNVLSHLFTPHSLGQLKEDNLRASGDYDRDHYKTAGLQFPTRAAFERLVMNGSQQMLISGARFYSYPPALAVVTTSNEITQYAQSMMPDSSDRLIFFPPGTDTTKYSQRQSVDDPSVISFFDYLVQNGILTPRLRRKIMQNPQKYTIIVDAGRMDETKRKHILVEALKEIESSKVLLFMTGSPDQQGVYQGLINTIQSSHLGHRAFLLGRVPNEHMGTLMSLPHGGGERQFKLMIGASASRMEGWGMAPEDAAAGGYVIVAASSVPFATHLQNEVDGAIVIPLGIRNEPQAYADAFKKLIGDPKSAREMAARAYEIVKELTWDKLFNAFDKARETLLSRSNGNR